MIRWAASMLALVALIMAAVIVAIASNMRDPIIARLGTANYGASDYFPAHAVPFPTHDKRGFAMATPVYFAEQEGIDHFCGGRNQVIACAQVGGGAMALPNPCQARFAGESYAAVACHEKGHILGWNHGEK
jgi:hypothetical protein